MTTTGTRTNSSLKEYYVNLTKMMNNASNMLSAINQSMTTSSSEVNVSLVGSDDLPMTVRIPSFLYLENKLEQLDTNFEQLFNMPESGEAWFQNSGNMYKLQLVKSNTVPVTPEIADARIGFSYKENLFLKDLVNPKTYIKLMIPNLPDNIDKMYMHKMVFYDDTIASGLERLESYDEYKAALSNKVKGVDYDEYDSVIDLPVKKPRYNSRFLIEEIPEMETGNPWTETTDKHSNLYYKVRLNTLDYTDIEDSSISFKLKTGDLLCLGNSSAIYKVKSVQSVWNTANTNDQNDHIVILEEYIGHISLQTFEENSEMVLYLYNDNYNDYHYVDVPLEENPSVAIFLGTIYNNVRSVLSKPILLNLNSIYLVDENGNYVLDDSGNYISYMSYYDKYCKNIGDLILGISETSYTQLSNYTNDELKRLTDSDEIKNLVNNTLSKNEASVLTVTKINSHLIDDVTSENILSLHEQKSEVSIQLNSVQNNIDQTYNQLTTTDFSQETSVTQETLRSQLNKYYEERLTLQKQLISIIDNINLLKGDVQGIENSKYRIRGITDSCDKNDSSTESPIVTYLHEQFGNKCNIVGLEVEYKYKSINKDTTTVESNANYLFTDWNKSNNVDRQRYLKFDESTGKYSIEFVNYNGSDNIIKWNQIDIPISQGEDVVLRIRYKYTIGQPFISIYTPWSDEQTISFPEEYVENIEISSVLAENENDVVSAKFTNTLINDGYQDHISNKLIDNSQVFYHMPENIYSGYNTPENKLISLKDKLDEICSSLDSYKALIDNELNAEYRVYLEWDNNVIELSNNTENNILINELINGSNDSFIRKDMNIVIKNTGSVAINLYSIFPGDVNTPLIQTDMEFYNQYVVNYERVPILKGGSNVPEDTILFQTLGQWIYFRQNNPFSKESIYFTSKQQNAADISSAATGSRFSIIDSISPSDYMKANKKQAMLGYRKRSFNSSESNLIWGNIELDINGEFIIRSSIDAIAENIDYSTIPASNYVYSDATLDSNTNKFILKYEHIKGTDKKNNGTPIYLSPNDSIDTFRNLYGVATGEFTANADFNGAFLIPEITVENQILCDKFVKNQYKKLDVGKSLSIPIIFEYYLDGTNMNTITKTLAFDIRSSILQNPENYILNVTAKYDYTQTNADVSNNISLVDALTE